MTEPVAPSATRLGVESDDRSLSRPTLLLLVTLALALCIGLCGLGVWQLERRVWKLELIERVTARTTAAATPAPDRTQWASLTPASAEYRRVYLRGRFLHDRETLVLASTVRGTGFWVITPLQCEDGTLVLINRGFVPTAQRDRSRRTAGNPTDTLTITGLVRMTEPEGMMLRRNRPAEDRWYSRDVRAITAARHLPAALTAPYFIDAAATPDAPATAPIGGLTVVSFYNQHLTYALTWFTLALLPLAFILFILRRERRLRSRSRPS